MIVTSAPGLRIGNVTGGQTVVAGIICAQVAIATLLLARPMRTFCLAAFLYKRADKITVNILK
jgi:hypothetical protein